jgi:phospholipid transport system transporter-binding protein
VDLKAQLMTRLDAVEAVQIDAAQLERIDAAAMQVLLAFVLERTKQQRNVEWCGVNPVMQEAAQALGLEAALRLPALEEAA